MHMPFPLTTFMLAATAQMPRGYRVQKIISVRSKNGGCGKWGFFG